MKCPYAVHRQTTAQTMLEYNADGCHTVTTEKINNMAYFVDCLKEECGAWHNEMCKYNASKDE